MKKQPHIVPKDGQNTDLQPESPPIPSEIALPSSRRDFLKKGGLAALGALLGTEVVFAAHFPANLIPVGLLSEEDAFEIPGKSEHLLLLNDRPINAETPPHLLDDTVTPAALFFVRNNGIPPEKPDASTWTLTIDGESAEKEVSFSLDELKKRFTHHTLRLTLECGGNGRAEFNPPAKGNQWGLGAVGCPEWTGVRLRDVLEAAGIKSDAVYIGYYGADTHMSGDLQKKPISRGVPMSKALADESLIAWAMNDEDLPLMNGFPLRLVFGGWPASTSGKWLERISIRNKIHDGPKMGGNAYRVPCKSVQPGAAVADEDMCIIESMPVKSIITFPKTGGILRDRKTVEVRGHAWAGDLDVKQVHVSIDFGATWRLCSLNSPANRHAWQQWKTTVSFPKEGYYEVWARATDTEDRAQPMVVPGWNPKGYLNNACHRIAVKVS